MGDESHPPNGMASMETPYPPDTCPGLAVELAVGPGTGPISFHEMLNVATISS